MKSLEEIREQYNTPSNYNTVLKRYFYAQEDVEKMMIEYHEQFDRSGLDYNKLREDLDKLLNSQTREDLINWLEMDRKRMRSDP